MQPDATEAHPHDTPSTFGVLDGPDGPAFTPPVDDADRAAVEEAIARVERLDRDGDGHVSLRETAQGHLAAIDDALIAHAATPGVVGGAAAALHLVVDRIDGDDTSAEAGGVAGI